MILQKQVAIKSYADLDLSAGKDDPDKQVSGSKKQSGKFPLVIKALTEHVSIYVNIHTHIHLQTHTGMS
jgi:hypothetical protein